MDQALAGGAVSALVEMLGHQDRPTIASGAGLGPLRERAAHRRPAGLALSCDSVGSKVIVCEQLGRYDTIGIDLFRMNANDVICVGADPIALLDYIAVEANPAVLEQIGVGLRGRGTGRCGVPGGGWRSCRTWCGATVAHGFDLVGFCVGLVDLDAVVTGARIEPGDAVIGIPSAAFTQTV